MPIKAPPLIHHPRFSFSLNATKAEDADALLRFPTFDICRPRTLREAWVLVHADAAGRLAIWQLGADKIMRRRAGGASDLRAAATRARLGSGAEVPSPMSPSPADGLTPGEERYSVVVSGSFAQCWEGADVLGVTETLPGLKTGDIITSFATVGGTDCMLNPMMCIGLESGDVILQTLDAFLADIYSNCNLQPLRSPARLSSHTGAVRCLFSPRHIARPLLLSGSSDYSVKLWDTSAGVLLHTFTSQCGEITRLSPVHERCMSQWRNCVCAVASDHSVALYDVEKRQCALLVAGHAFPIRRLLWRPAEDFLVVSCVNGSIYVWQLSTGHLESTASGQAAADIVSQCASSPRQPAERYPLAPMVARLSSRGDVVALLILDLEQAVLTLSNLARLSDGGGGSQAASPLPSKDSRPASPGEEAGDLSAAAAAAGAATGCASSQALVLDAIMSLVLRWKEGDEATAAAQNLSLLGPSPGVQIGIVGANGKHALLLPGQREAQRWTLSSYMATSMLLSACALAHARSRVVEEGEMQAKWLLLTTLYTVGEGQSATGAPRDLRLLAHYWNHRLEDLKEAARTLLNHGLRQMDPTSMKVLVHQLTADVPTTYRQLSDEEVASALLLSVAVQQSDCIVPEAACQSLATLLMRLLRDEDAPIPQRSTAANAIATSFSTLGTQGMYDGNAVMGVLVQASSKDSRDPMSRACTEALSSIAQECPRAFASGISALVDDVKSGFPEVTLVMLRRLVKERPLVLVSHLHRIMTVVINTLNPNAGAVRQQCSKVRKRDTLDLEDFDSCGPPRHLSIFFHFVSSLLT